ncbi:hypothetical protein LguiA_005733 [Lonicera macranthoides]
MRKLNRNSWSPGVNLHQAKMFSSNDYYSKVGSEAQHHVQQRTSWISQSTGMDFNSCPSEYVKPLKGNNHLNHFACIPLIQWNCPPKFSMDYEWHVAFGEESEEKVSQKHREMRVVEAVYPHLSAIPPSPYVSLDVEICHQDDSTIPVIPITAIEEAAEPSPNIKATQNTSVHSQAPDLPPGKPTPRYINTPQSLNPPSSPKKHALGVLPSFDGNVAVAAASAALTALIESQEKGSLIDTDLLIKILSDPKMIEKLTNEHGAADNTGGDRLSVPKLVTESLPLAPRPEMVTKKSMNDHGAPATIGTAPISRPTKTFTPLVPFSGLNPVVIKNLTNENGSHGCMSPTPISWSSSVPLPSSKPVDMTIKNWINEHCSAETAGSKLVTPTVPLPRTKPDLVITKRMFNEYGAPVNMGSKPVNEYGAPANMGNKPVPWPANLLQSGIGWPSPGTTQTPPFLAPSAPLLKDINYIKGLIQEHGEKREKQDSDLLQFGKLYNDLPGPESVKNIKSYVTIPKNEKHCIYFSSSRGCRKGTNCLYKHDKVNGSSRDMGPRPVGPGRVPGASDAKRLRL